MKKGENTRSHSWWWDSHNSPKNSKWLQENLSEMDTKVNAMLKIIEEDADSFAQRAEMYYKKRPELINLVEEFYRTYRALVERYTFLTREIRQNMAPALQAQLGVSSESAQNSPVDLHIKRGGLDGPDIISPSYSYTGASEFDCDSPFSARGPVDEDELSPSGFETYGFRPKFLSPGTSTPKASESGQLYGTLDGLQKDFLHLQEENRALVAKSSEDARMLESFQLEVSGLQAKFRSLEAEEKVNKKRFNSVQEQGKRLEAENLKLSHALMTSKEERTELAEKHSKLVEESKVANQKHLLLEDEMVALRVQLHTARMQASERKEAEEATQKLHQALTALKEQRAMDARQLRTYEHQSHELHAKILDVEQERARLKEEILAQESVVKSLEAQLKELNGDKTGLEEELFEHKEEVKALKHEREESSSKMAQLQRELAEVCKVMECLSDQVMQQTGEIAGLKEALTKLEEENTRLETEKVEAARHVRKLEANVEEGRKDMETLKASCQQEEERCIALELARTQLEAEFVSRSEEATRLGKQIATLEDVAVEARLKIEELEKRVSSLMREKTVLAEQLEKASEHAQMVERACLQMHEVGKGKQEKVEELERRCTTLSADIERLNASLLDAVEERSELMKRGAETLQAHHRLESEHDQLREALEEKLSLTRELEDRLCHMENEKSEMALESHRRQQSIACLKEQITSLHNQWLRSRADQEAAEEAARKAQRELGYHVVEREQLQKEVCAKAEQNCELRDQIELLEARLAQLMEEKSSLAGEFEEHTRKLARVEAQTHTLTTSLSTSLSEITVLSERLSQKDNKIDLLSSELSAAKSQAVVLNEEVGAKTSHAFSLQNQLHSLHEQLARLHEDTEKSSETRRSLQRVVDELWQRVSKGDKTNHLLAQEKLRLSDELLAMKEASRGLEANLLNLREERELLLQKATAQLEQCKDMEERIKSLGGEFEEARNESEALKEQLAKSEEDKKTLEEENMSCSRKLFEAEGRIQDLQLRISKLLVEKVALADQVSEKMKALHTLEAELLEKEREKAALGEEVHLLKQKVHTLEGMEASLLVDLHRSSELNQILKGEVETLQQEGSMAAETHKGLAQKSLDESLVMTRQIEDLQAISSLLNEEKSRLTRDMASHLAWSKELEAKVERLEDANASLQQDLSSTLEAREKLDEDLIASHEEKDQLSQALGTCKNEMRKQEEELESLQQALSHVKGEQGVTMDKMNRLIEEKEALERGNVALLSELREAKDEAERARCNLLNLETGFSHLQQMNATFSSELHDKLDAVKALQEEISSLQGTKADLEEKLQVSSTQLAAHEAEAQALEEILASAQNEKRSLGGLWVADREASQMEVGEEHSKREGTRHVLKQEVAAIISVKTKLEEELSSVQEEQAADKQKMERMQHEVMVLQEQQAKALADLNAAEKKFQEEIMHSKALGLQERSDLQGSVAKLEREVWTLQAERKALEEDKTMTAARMLDLQQQMEALRLELLEKEELVLSLSAQVDRLQRTLSSTELEMAALEEVARKDRESFGAAEEALKTELLICQREVASKGEEISELTATLHGLKQSRKMLMEEMSAKELLHLEVQEGAKAVKEENTELAQKLQVGAADLLQSRGEVEALAAALHELHDRFLKLQGHYNDIEAANLEVQEGAKAVKDENMELMQKLQIGSADLLQSRGEVEALAAELHELRDKFLKLQGHHDDLEAAILEVQEGAKALKEENMELTQKLQVGATDLLQSRGEVEAFAAELHELRDRFFKLQGHHDNIEAANQAQAAEKVLLAKQIKEITSALSGLHEENVMLRGNLAAKSTALTNTERDTLLLKDQLAEAENRNGPHQGHTMRSIEVKDEVEETTSQADMGKPDLLEKELEAAQGDNGKLREMVSTGATAVIKLQEEAVKLHDRNQVLQEESELAHTEVQRLHGELSNMQTRVKCFDAESTGLKEELENTRAEVTRAQSMVLDLQGKSLESALLLKENLLLSCKGIKAIAEEWQKFVSEKGADQIMEGIEKLSALQNLCAGQGIVDKKMQSAGESSLEEVAMKSLQHKSSWPDMSKDFVLDQLKRRADEMDLLREAVGTMVPPSSEQAAVLCRAIPQVPKEDMCEIEVDEHQDPLLIQVMCESEIYEHQDPPLITDPIFASMEEHNTEPASSMEESSSVEDEIARKLIPQEYEGLEIGSLDHDEQIQLMHGLARLHINLGMRLHQAMMDEKLEHELLELKEERKRLQEDLQVRVEQVQRMEAELERLQALLKEGSEKDKKMRKVERRARRISEELVHRRQQVGNMQEVVMSWAQQQEVATEKLEEQVLSLVSMESAPTMEGWDAEQVNLLMRDMQVHKALTRRHSLELQTVGQELQKVGSSIESTQRQLLCKEKQDGDDADEELTSDTVAKPGKLKRLGLAWLRLLTKERKGLLRRSRSKRSLAIPALTTRASSITSATSTSMSTVVAQTRRLGCCACGLAPYRSKSGGDNKERRS